MNGNTFTAFLVTPDYPIDSVTCIGEYTRLENARRAARRELARWAMLRPTAYLEGHNRNGLFLTEAVEPLVAPVVHPPRAFRVDSCPGCEPNTTGLHLPASPPHDPSWRCESGRRPHCSCDACF